MTTPPGGLQHVEKTADALVEDVVQWVKTHPAYQHLVEQLGLKALETIAAAAGVSL